MRLFTLRFPNLSPTITPTRAYAHLSTGTASTGPNGGTPATLSTVERLQCGPQPSGDLLRLLVVTKTGEQLRSELPLQKVTHPFFMAPYSEYPLLLGVSLAGVLGGTVNYLHAGFLGLASEPFLLLLLLASLRWCGDLEQLGANPALYNGAVRRNVLLGILLFIVSEVMIFFALFWTFFHSALNPSVELGAVWPPLKLAMLEWMHWPTLNTALLVYSGGAANVGLYALQNLNLASLVADAATTLVARLRTLTPPTTAEQLLFGSALVAGEDGRRGQLRLQLHRVYGGFLYAVVCGALFLLCQLHEYNSAGYAMSDGIYGSVFYGLTGLHGLHVLAGLLLLLLVLYRLWRGFFDRDQNTADGPTGGVWYWHFVDVVWLALFALLYLWGNSRGTLPLAELYSTLSSPSTVSTATPSLNTTTPC